MPCFVEGTKILCLIKNEEVYVPIENIEIGTKIKTYPNTYHKLLHKTKIILNNSLT